ncbi:MAG TPA: CHAT domain-containing protein [Symbiobacteriaceae bacterium]|nr:CHAT domain-containing protein [Symbiobacteriaceae bacterium]
MDLMQHLLRLQDEHGRYGQSDLTRARAIAEEALAISAGAGQVARALALRICGNDLRMRGRLREAYQAVSQALRLFLEAGEKLEWARTVNATIPILVGLDRNAEAIATSKAALAWLMQNGERAAAGRLLNNMGNMYGNMGQPLAALECFERCEALAAETGQWDYVVRVQGNRALVLQQLGRHHESISVAAKTLRWWLKQDAKIAVARALQTGAIGLFHLGRFGKALRRFAKARDLFDSQASPRDVAVCDLYIAACYLELNRYDQTIARTRMVAEVLDPAQNGFQFAWAHLYEGVALARTGRVEEARRLLTAACRWFEEHGHSAWAGKARLEEADLLLSLGEANEASKAAGKSARLFAAAHMNTEEARAYLLRAESSLRAGRLSAAEQSVAKAYPRFSRAHMPGPAFRCLHVRGQLAMRRKDWDGARRLLTRAVATAERMRATVQVSFRRTLLEDKSSAYADLVWVHLQMGRIKAAHRLVDQAKSRALVDELAAVPRRRSQVDDRDQALLTAIERVRREYQELTAPLQLGPEQAVALRSGAAEPLSAKRAQLEERLAALWDQWELRNALGLGSSAPGRAPDAAGAYRRLAPGAAMVEYFAAGSRLIAFVSDRRGLKGWVDLGAPERVWRALELLQLNLDTAVVMTAAGRRDAPGLSVNARALLAALYESLWAPLLPLLGARQSIVVIPHGILHLVPFEALCDGTRYLVELTELSLAPSRAVWMRCQERAEALAPGHPDLVLGCSAGGALPFVEAEVRSIAGALGAAPRLGREAAGHLLGACGPRRVVHLSAHGEFRLDNPYFSTLLLADGPLTMADVSTLRLDCSLVVLSGCETGLSRVTRGEELMGMVSAFLQAGSASVLASRWRVDDRVTADLMDRFYTALLAGEGKAAALRSAQCAIAGSGVHPLYWAAFGLIGHSGALN